MTFDHHITIVGRNKEMNITCPCCKVEQDESNFVLLAESIRHTMPSPLLIPMCDKCSNEHLIEKQNCTCSVCKRSLPSECFQHYRSRLKDNGMRLRVNRNCKDCSRKESAVLAKLKKDNPPPAYNTPCPQCNRIVYEKSEDIPEGVDGANGPWQCDHDHSKGEFRGYVCKQCNTGTGLIGDNQEYWTKAVERKKDTSIIIS